MTRLSHRRSMVLGLFSAVAVALAAPAASVASEPPIKEILTSHIGWEVDAFTKGQICTAASLDTCQPGKESSAPGGFAHALGVGGGKTPAGHVYVADGGNSRVQELASDGEFIAMFGWNVNKTKEEEGAPQSERNVCTLASGDTCQAGTEGTNPGQFTSPQSIAVDTANNDFYIAELDTHTISERVQKFTANGEFILELGKEVNAATKGNLCTQAEIANCKGAANGTKLELTPATSEPGAFGFEQSQGNILTVGGPENHLYVGDEHTVQEFRPDGTWAGEPLGKSDAMEKRLTEISSAPRSNVTRIAVDLAGIVYVGYTTGLKPPTEIREFDQSGKEVNEFATAASVSAIAVDDAGRLAVVENSGGTRHNYLFEVAGSKLHLMTEFVDVHADDITFNGNDELFGVVDNEREIVAYHPVPVAELLLGPTECKEGTVHETSVTLGCTLNGMANPEEVPETEAWFKWGRTSLMEEETPKQLIPTGNAPVAVSALIEGVRPNEALYIQLAGEDQNVKAPEQLTSEQELFHTPAVRPRIVGEPQVSFVGASTVLMSGSLNPENANTIYRYEYGPCEEGGCATSPYTGHTTERESHVYAKVKAIIEASELQPSTKYHYRLTAENEAGAALNEDGEAELPEGTFTTASEPIPVATSGGHGAIGVTSVLITGTVNPEGQPSSFSFEAQRGDASAAKYLPVYTGDAGAGVTPVQESFLLTGLQPGTQYTYRITARNGFGETVGLPVTIVTQGLPVVLVAPKVLPQLPLPPIAFPKVTVKSAVTPAQRLARALKACARKPARKRAACRRVAHKSYAAAKAKRGRR
jgi:hypothetical protein